MSAGAWVQDIAQGVINGGSSASATISLTVGTSVLAGDLIVVRVFGYTSSNSTTNCSVSDNGPGYTYNTAAYSSDGNDCVWIFFAIATSGLASSSIVTVHLSNLSLRGGTATIAAASATEHAGPFLSSPLDQVQSNTQSAVTSLTTGTTGTLTQASELAVAAFAFVSSTSATITLTSTNSFTTRTSSQFGWAPNGGQRMGVLASDKVVNATTALAGTGTVGTSLSVAVSAVATLKLATDPYPLGYPPPSRTWW